MNTHFPRDPAERVVRRNSAHVHALVDEAINLGRLQDFGLSLHTFQDSWSHENYLNEHIADSARGRSPDRTWVDGRWSGRDLEMAEFTYSKLEAFLDFNPAFRAGPTRPFPELAPCVIAYLQLDTLVAKEWWLRLTDGIAGYAVHIGTATRNISHGDTMEVPVYRYLLEELK